eukprot:NODE_83_length_22684_cov_0.307934.p2 type:complete len:519 gc:universal NODE_83_length_22684_cov_0.307934:13702-15258(+)
MLWTVLFAQFTVPCANPRLRKDFRRYTTQEWADFTRAFKSMKSSGELSKFAALHWSIYGDIHSGVSVRKRNFLTWHRAFIYELETRLRQISGKPITLPYVDWGNEADVYKGAVSKSVAFKGYYYGEMVGQCLTGNIYDSFSLRPDFVEYNKLRGDNRQCIYTTTNTAVPVGGWATVDGTIFNKKAFASFSDDVEYSIHYQVHTHIGGLMTSKISPIVPIFFAVHSFVDLMFTTWQYVHNQWKNMPESFSKSTFQILSGKTYTHEQVYGMNEMCVRYERVQSSSLSSKDRNTLSPKLLKRMSELQDLHSSLISEPTATTTHSPTSAATLSSQESTETETVVYLKPVVTVPTDQQVLEYNTKLNSYYNEVKAIYSKANSNETDADDEAYTKCAQFYGNSSFIPVTTKMNSTLLNAFHIDPVSYQKHLELKNKRNIQIAQHAKLPVYVGSSKSTDYKKVQSNLNATYKGMRLQAETDGKTAMIEQAATATEELNSAQTIKAYASGSHDLVTAMYILTLIVI